MKVKLIYLIVVMLIFFGCTTTDEKKQDDSKLSLTVFDSIAPAIKQYYLMDSGYYRGKLDTCRCSISNDTLKLNIETLGNFGGQSGLRINYFNNGYTGYFFEASDTKCFQYGSDPGIKFYIEIPTDDLRIEFIKNGKKGNSMNNFQVDDSIEGYIWTTSKVYQNGERPVRDRFEDFIKCVIKR